MCHSTIKMNPVDTRCTIYIDFNVENNDKNPKFNVGDHVRISKYKNIFGKVYALKKFLSLKKMKLQCQGHILLVLLTVKKLSKHFTKNHHKRQVKLSLGLKKIKNKSDKLYVQWKGYDSSIDEKDI